MKQGIRQTVGLDLGDRYSTFSVIDERDGHVLERGRVPTTPPALEAFFVAHPQARVVMEVGTHSPWVSRIAQERCAQTVVANARALRFIFDSSRKSDVVDAAALARVGRLDTELLCPIHHRGEQAQLDLSCVRARSALVSARTALVNSLRGLIKAHGHRLPKQSAKSIRAGTIERVPAALHQALRPMLQSIEMLTEQIQVYDRSIEKLATERYPETALLAQVPGVGPLTALAYVLTLESPGRFARGRDVGAFLGLVPRRDQSGETDKQLGITKAGDRLLRALLVQCAHYVLGRHGPPCALQEYGERIAARGGPIAKRKAVVAVARKLAVLLHALWRTGEVYDAQRNRRSTAA